MPEDPQKKTWLLTGIAVAILGAAILVGVVLKSI
jgi:hypothetical protein